MVIQIRKLLYGAVPLIACLMLLSVTTAQGAAETGGASPLPSGSVFLDKVDTERYPSLPAPASPPLLRWNFGGKRVVSYKITHDIVVNRGGAEGKAAPPGVQSLHYKGSIFVRSDRQGIAQLSAENLLLTIEIVVPGKKRPITREVQVPAMVVEEMKEDGTGKISGASNVILMTALFPLPSTPLEVGESVAASARIPVTIAGATVNLDGSTEIALADYVKIDGAKCAKLVTTFDLSALDLPEALKGRSTARLTGRSVFYFDLKRRAFHSGNAALLLSTREEGVPSMDQDNFIAVDYWKR